MGKETGERESAETKATSALDGLSSTGVESIVTDPVQLSIPPVSYMNYCCCSRWKIVCVCDRWSSVEWCVCVWTFDDGGAFLMNAFGQSRRRRLALRSGRDQSMTGDT